MRWSWATTLAALAVLVIAPVARAGDQTITFPTGSAAGAYMPADVNIDAGNTVTFNGAFANHPLVWDANTFDRQSSGSSRAYTFPQAGLFRFHCDIHATMVGSVRVGAPNGLATPDFTWAPASPQAGQAVTFTPSGFTDPDGSIARYEWDLDGDGTFETTAAAPSHTYGAAGDVTVRLRYVDDHGETSSATAHALTVRAAAAGGGPGGPGSTGGGSPGQSGGSGHPTGSGDDQGAGSGGAQTSAPRLRIATRALAFRGGRAHVAVSAARATKITVTLRRGRTVLATGRATARRAGRVTVTVKLTRAGARALRGARTVRATLIASARGAKPSAAARRTVTVRLGAG